MQEAALLVEAVPEVGNPLPPVQGRWDLCDRAQPAQARAPGEPEASRFRAWSPVWLAAPQAWALGALVAEEQVQAPGAAEGSGSQAKTRFLEF